jgi:hypothetical protein
MRYEQALNIARRLGRLRNQEGIDRQTYNIIIEELESTIQATSRILDSPDHLYQFRTLLKGEQNADLLPLQGSKKQRGSDPDKVG